MKTLLINPLYLVFVTCVITIVAMLAYGEITTPDYNCNCEGYELKLDTCAVVDISLDEKAYFVLLNDTLWIAFNWGIEEKIQRDSRFIDWVVVYKDEMIPYKALEQPTEY